MVVASSVPSEVVRLFEALRMGEFRDDEIYVRPSTSGILKAPEWCEIVVVRTGWEAVLHIRSAFFIFSEEALSRAIKEINELLWFVAVKIAAENESKEVLDGKAK